MEKQIQFKGKFEIASTQFGGMLGAGIASGAAVTLYFVQKNGYFAIIVPLISLCLLFLIYYMGMETSRLYGLENHTQLYNLLYGKSAFSKFFTILANITVFYMMLLSSAMAFGGAGSIFEQYFNAPSILGGTLTAIACIMVIYFGMDVFKRLQSAFSLIMFAILTISYVTALSKGGMTSVFEKVAIRWMPETASIGGSIWWGLSFTAMYIGFLPLLISAGKSLKSSQSIRSTLSIGYVLNLSAVYLPCIAILAYAPEATQAGIPSAYVVEQAGIPFATQLYLILLIFALISTGASCLITIGLQISPLLEKRIPSPKVRNSVIYILFAIVFTLFAPLGLTGTMKLLAPIANVFCIFALGLPICLFAPGKIIKKYKMLKTNE
ncbi:hypothetical protein [Fusibacter ferrireducens]|uniref:Amino acid permease n=1 Tax=Fusibacter ferrireducens TaxID=2785058 RepID=A0ABR9ZYT6_9FIRM|nr:hypothetical protein [Fusibacter ferrireducens]MBF4694744.1 hypothetical protein [Fusibacter ferrireducens]